MSKCAKYNDCPYSGEFVETPEETMISVCEDCICFEEKKKIYISGAISNNPSYKKQFTDKFKELESEYRVLTPLFINADLSWKEYMKIDLAMIKICDCIYMMKGWKNSRGAQIENIYAGILGKEIIYEE